jgi:hypothetical protein
MDSLLARPAGGRAPAASTAVGIAPVFWLLAACLLGGAWFARRRLQADL